MTDFNWVDVGEPKSDDWSQVSLWIPCPQERWLMGLAVPWTFRCDEHEVHHGHIALNTEDGLGIIPAKIESRPYLRAVCDYLVGKRSVYQEERDAILALPEAETLAAELTDRERAVLEDPKGLEEATRFGFMSC
jgi:hypothetical protein